MMKSGKPASLLLVALMILASATVVPLPGLENHPEGAAALKSDVASNDQSVLSGNSPHKFLIIIGSYFIFFTPYPQALF